MPMKAILVFIWLLLGEAASTYAQEQILFDEGNDRYWSKSVIVPEERFTVPEVEAMGQTFLNEVAEGRILVQLSVFTSGEEAAMNADFNRESYAQWRAYYDRVAQRPLRMAQVTAIRGNAVLRVRRADGTVLRRVLSGKDPLHIESDGVDFEILVLRFRRGTIFDRCQPAGTLSPAIAHVMTDSPLTAGTCDHVTDELTELLGTKILFVGFKNDHWFITSGGYPVIYQFATPSEPPSEAEYYRSTAYSCMIWCDYRPPCQQVGELDPPPPGRRGADND